MAVMIQIMIINNETYCFISKDVQKIVINQYLGYDWNKKAILITINIQINHRIHNQFFLNMMLEIDTNTWIIRTQNDINNHTG
jgi:hypothetical protein